jgi:hypothetical protein
MITDKKIKFQAARELSLSVFICVHPWAKPKDKAAEEKHITKTPQYRKAET